MATNLYFSQKVRSEQQLYEDIVIESLKMFGQDIYYLPRTLVAEDTILGEDVASKFGTSYKIEMYIENTEGFDGEGDLFSRFGVEIRDQATFVVSRRRWTQVGRRFDNELDENRPKEGDLIYLPMTNKLFEVMHVEHESPFYQLSNLPVFKLRCELFEYSDEDLDTGVDAIDAIEQKAYSVYLTLNAWESGDSDLGHNPNFKPGEHVSSGSITADVVAYNHSTRILELAQLQDSDGGWVEFSVGDRIRNDDRRNVDSAITRTIASISEILPESDGSQNAIFSTQTSQLEFLDFSEANPFGDPEDD